QELDWMQHLDARAFRQQPGTDLHDTTRIPSCNHRSAARSYRCKLLVQNLRTQLRVLQIIDPCAPAAGVGARERDHGHAGRSLQQSQGSIIHSLSVYKVTGRIVGYRRFEPPFGPLNPGCRQNLRYIANSRAEFARLCRELPITREPVPVLFHRRAAARCVGNNQITPARFERVDVPCRKRPRCLLVTGMRMQCAAANLSLRVNHRKAVCLERPFSRAVYSTEESLHHTSLQQRDPCPIRNRRRDRSRMIGFLSLFCGCGAFRAARKKQCEGKPQPTSTWKRLKSDTRKAAVPYARKDPEPQPK